MYRRVEVAMWTDEKFMRLSSMKPSGQSLWLYLITGRCTSVIPGLIAAKTAELAGALGWTTRATSKSLSEIAAQGMLRTDSAGLIWLPNALKHNRPANHNIVKSWKNPWRLAPQCPLKDDVRLELKQFVEPLGKLFAKALAEVFGEQTQNGLEKGIENQKTVSSDQRTVSSKSELEGGFAALRLTAPAEELEQASSLSAFPGASKLSKTKRKTLEAHAADTLTVWALMNKLRQEAIPGARELAPVAESAQMLSERLSAGHSVQDCEHVLRVAAAESGANPDAKKWFQPSTLWRPENFARKLGMEVKDAAARNGQRNVREGHYLPDASRYPDRVGVDPNF